MLIQLVLVWGSLPTLTLTYEGDVSRMKVGFNFFSRMGVVSLNIEIQWFIYVLFYNKLIIPLFMCTLLVMLDE